MVGGAPAEWYRGRTVAVTGAFGYLGSALSQRLLEAGAIVRRGTRSRTEPHAFKSALEDPASCDRLVDGADAVFHFAAQTSIKIADDDPVRDLGANVISTLQLLEACRRSGREPAFVLAGTATQIGLTTTVPIPPTRHDVPITIYDSNKLAAEHLVGVYSEARRVAGVTLRIANVYGPGAAKSAADRGVTNRIVGRALAGQDLTYYGDGSLVRDYVYVDDLIDAFFLAGPLAKSATERSYVVAGGRGWSLKETFELISEVVASLGRARVRVSSVPWPDGSHAIDRRSFVADISGLHRWLGWQPTTSLREGLTRTAVALSDGL